MLWTPLEGLEKIEFKENFKNKNFRRVLKNIDNVIYTYGYK